MAISKACYKQETIQKMHLTSLFLYFFENYISSHLQISLKNDYTQKVKCILICIFVHFGYLHK